MKFKLLSKKEGSIAEKNIDAAFTVILVPWCLCGWTNNIKVSFPIRLAVFLARGGAYMKNGISKIILQPLWLSAFVAEILRSSIV